MNPLKSLFEYYILNTCHKGKRHIVRLILTIIPFHYIRSHYGPKLCCNPIDKTNIFAISGQYGNVISDHVESFEKDDIFIDIGANYGLYSLLAAEKLRLGKVFSFEPNPVSYRYFLNAIYLNKLKNIIPFNCAISEKSELLNLKYDEQHSGTSSLIFDKNKNQSSDFTVPAFNISKWDILDTAFAQSDIHIKIDVEGYEYSVVQVLKQANWFHKVKSIIVEIDEENLKRFGTSSKAVYEALESLYFTASIGLDSSKHYDEIFTKSSPHP